MVTPLLKVVTEFSVGVRRHRRYRQAAHIVIAAIIGRVTSSMPLSVRRGYIVIAAIIRRGHIVIAAIIGRGDIIIAIVGAFAIVGGSDALPPSSA